MNSVLGGLKILASPFIRTVWSFAKQLYLAKTYGFGLYNIHPLQLYLAKVRCSNGGTIISCNYDPPGNYVNQHPYLRVIQEVLGIYNA